MIMIDLLLGKSLEQMWFRCQQCLLGGDTSNVLRVYVVQS